MAIVHGINDQRCELVAAGAPRVYSEITRRALRRKHGCGNSLGALFLWREHTSAVKHGSATVVNASITGDLAPHSCTHSAPMHWNTCFTCPQRCSDI